MDNSAICRDKIEGMFLGVAIGDALGAPVEARSGEEIGKKYGRIEEYHDTVDNPFIKDGLKAGTWTDDTQLTLVVAESLIAKGRIDMDDLADRHIRAMKESSVGWGKSTRNAVKRLTDGAHWRDSGMPLNPGEGVGNGVVMKLSPVAAYFAAHHERPIRPRISSHEIVEKMVAFNCMTHRTRMAFSATLAHVNALEYCLFISTGFSRVVFKARTLGMSEIGDLSVLDPKGEEPDRFPDRMRQLEEQDWTKKSAAEIADLFGQGGSYVYNSLPFCYAFFLKAPDSIETLYETVSAGGDTDTNGSIVGAMLGSLNGKSIFPKHLVDGLWQKDRILATARKFCRKFKIPEIPVI